MRLFDFIPSMASAFTCFGVSLSTSVLLISCIPKINGYTNVSPSFADKLSVSTPRASAPNPPTISLPPLAPGISFNPNPVLEVSGVEIGSTVSIFTDSSCSPSSSVSLMINAPTSTVDLQSSTLPADGTYHFYAQQTDLAGNISDCSSVSVQYTLDRQTLALSPSSVPHSILPTSRGIALLKKIVLFRP